MQGNHEFKLRNTVAADIPKLRAMHGQSWRDTYLSPEHGVTKEWLEERTARWVSPEGIARSVDHFKPIFGQPDHLHQVAIDENGDIAGMVHIAKGEQGQHLEALYIDKRYFGTGLGQRLMDATIAWAGPTQRIYLEVATYNERAKAFYRKYQFKEIPGTEQFFAEILPVITMEREGEQQ